MNDPSDVLLLGGGRMGGALARGWQARERIWLFDPNVDGIDGTRKLERLEDASPDAALTLVVAVKPQIVESLLPRLRPFADRGCLIVSIAAGVPIARYRQALGASARIVRAMPNTPAAVLRGITAAVGSGELDVAGRRRAESLFSAVGEVIWLNDEAQLDAVTALSGSGPAYFVLFAETLARAGRALGLDEETAMSLARATFVGSAALADARSDRLDALRAEVTSPGGTTAAALAVLGRGDALDTLVAAALAAAAARSRELAT